MAVILTPTSLQNRQLQCKITLQSGTFNQGFNTLTVNDATINAIVNTSMNNNFTNSSQITIYGMNKSDIAALSTLGFAPLKYELNTIELYAQYENDPSSLCFTGFIVKAWADYSDPSRPMHFECQTTYQDAINNVDPINLKGSINITDLFSNLASKLGLSLQNNGVTGIINNPIFTGSVIDQLKNISKQTGINCVIDNNKLKIAPKTFSFSNEIVNINSDSGLLSYPTIDAWGVKFRIRYNPVLQIGQYVALQTSVPIPNSQGQQIRPPLRGNGNWFVYDMQSSLNNRHENWYTDLRCSYNNQNFG